MAPSNRTTSFFSLSWLIESGVLIFAVMLAFVLLAILTARNTEMLARELVAEAEALASRSEYLQQRQCVVADMAKGEALGYRCNKPTAGQYVSSQRITAVLGAKVAYLKTNNCQRVSHSTDALPTYRCKQSAPVVLVSEATVLELAEKGYLLSN